MTRIGQKSVWRQTAGILAALMLATVLWLWHLQLARAVNDYENLYASSCYGQGWASYSTDYGRTWTSDYSGQPCQRYLDAWYYNSVLEVWWRGSGMPQWSGYDIWNQDYAYPYTYSHQATGTHNLCTVLYTTCNGYVGTVAYR